MPMENPATNIVKKIQLHSSADWSSTDKISATWAQAIEYAIQQSIDILSNRRVTGEIRLESTSFIELLSKIAKEWHREEEPDIPELMLFSRKVGLYSFQLNNREFVCFDFSNDENDPSKESGSKLDNASIIKKLNAEYNSANMKLTLEPSFAELAAILLDHIHEHQQKQSELKNCSLNELELDKNDSYSRVHSARRSALRNWEGRLNQLHQTKYDLREVEKGFYSYPYVAAETPDGVYMLVLFVSPIDENFVNKKVPLNNRAPEITLAIFDVSNSLYPDAIKEIIPLLKQSFARVLFTNMLKETDQALKESFKEQASILREWARIASDGVTALLDEDQLKGQFNAFAFCESVIKRVLCGSIPGNEESEIYPFNRAILFKEAGTSSVIDNQPMEVHILEASMLSNNPADRSRYLTARERRIRGTEDYECNPAKKIIENENVFRFYIHKGNAKALILSCEPELSDVARDKTLRENWKSRTPGEAKRSGYRIKLPDIEDVDSNGAPAAVYNLLGRLISTTHRSKPIEDPLDTNKKYEVQTYTEDFERLRLGVTECFDDNGLYFSYDHGVNLAIDHPLLYEIQNAYFQFLDDYFQDQDIKFYRDRYRQDNMSPSQIDEILKSHKIIKKQMEHSLYGLRGSNKIDKANRQTDKHKAKVVYISFSWALHDENMRRLMEVNESLQDDEKQRELLGEEYTYTIILVTGKDNDKTEAKLLAEKEDLNLFFKMVMRQIWIDKLKEYSYLEKKSRSISGTLNQFLHRTKHLIPDKTHKQELDDFIKNLKVLMEPNRSRLKIHEVQNVDQIFKLLSFSEDEMDHKFELLNEKISNIVCEWKKNASNASTEIQVDIVKSEIPPVKLHWSTAVVRDAFTVALKNAVEATMLNNTATPYISIQIQASPLKLIDRSGKWFVDIVIENTGGAINPELLEKLNASDPAAVGKNPDKDNSTGIGVFLARYQLQEVIGLGADMLILNIANEKVQTRIRIPAFLIDKGWSYKEYKSPTHVPKIPYVLYVEDDPEYFEPTIAVLNEITSPLGFDIVHTKGVSAAIKTISQKLPIVVVSDWHILRDESNTDISSPKWGGELIANISKLGDLKNFFPPIWILSSEDLSNIKQRLSKIQKGPYQIVSAKLTDHEKIIQNKVISVFEDVKTLGGQGERNLLTRLLKNSIMPYESERALDQSKKERLPKNDLIRILHLRNGKFDDNLEILGPFFREDQCNGAVFIAQASTAAVLAKNISAWISHPGIIDPDPLFDHDSSIYNLSDHVIHKRLLLTNIVSDKLFSELHPCLLYWGLTKNMWFSQKGQETDELFHMWNEIPHEERGPMSTFRHNVKNSFGRKKLIAILNEIVELSYQFENLVAMSLEEQRIIEKALLSSNIKPEHVKKILRTNTSVKKAKSDCRIIIQKIDGLLSEGLKKEPIVDAFVRAQIRILQILDGYIGG
jgi:hypothetical protein